jgi:hypothetical protein
MALSDPVRERVRVSSVCKHWKAAPTASITNPAQRGSVALGGD